MYSSVVTAKSTAEESAPQSPAAGAASAAARPLADEHRDEVLTFLAARPIHTIMMSGFIRDNGLVSPLNRGSFYAYRDTKGGLEGVALIGEVTLLEARTEAALAAFARIAQGYLNGYIIVGEQEKVERFWTYYAAAGQPPRLFCRELLYELRRPAAACEPVRGLRVATHDDLEAVMKVHAEMAYQESGIDPREADPQGFRRRCMRRIGQGRVWVLTENERLIFKADIISESPEVIYLEGLHVSPGERGQGYGVRCLSQLSRTLLARAGSICLLVNEQNREARALYHKANYRLRSRYDTIFLQR